MVSSVKDRNVETTGTFIVVVMLEAFHVAKRNHTVVALLGMVKKSGFDEEATLVDPLHHTSKATAPEVLWKLVKYVSPASMPYGIEFGSVMFLNVVPL